MREEGERGRGEDGREGGEGVGGSEGGGKEGEEMMGGREGGREGYKHCFCKRNEHFQFQFQTCKQYMSISNTNSLGGLLP